MSQWVIRRVNFDAACVGNTGGWSQADWTSEIQLAQLVGIDAFALNIAANDSNNTPQLANAFAAAGSKGFQLFFSFDYAGHGPWAQGDVMALIKQYGSAGTYFKRNGKPFVSTFEGPDNAADWVNIKAQTGCFLIPDWSSYGAAAALQLANGVADGLFNWAAWAWGGGAMNTYVDASYMQFLNGKPYMMPVSPWFYTNLPQYDKNWMWSTMTLDLWEQRWIEVLTASPQPDYIEIISWNDFGESHYIAGVRPSPPFNDPSVTKKPPVDYVTGMSHDGWRAQLSAWIQLYKTGTASIKQEFVTTAYLLNSVNNCKDGGTSVNTASQLQFEYPPSAVLNSAFLSYTAVLGSSADVTVIIGGTALATGWTTKPANGVGVYHGTVNIGTHTGSVQVQLRRNNNVIATINGKSIGACAANGYATFNPYSDVAVVPGSISATASVVGQVCTAGTGAQGFATICSITCAYGYCPIGACVCTQIGPQKTYPTATTLTGYAKSDPNYAGLCSWCYTFGFASQVSAWCSSTQQPTSSPLISPFLPFVCTAGKSNGAVAAPSVDNLCAFTCAHGYCPLSLCLCSSTGALLIAPGSSGVGKGVGAAAQYADNQALSDLCAFACNNGFCPFDTCYPGAVFSGEVAGSDQPWYKINCSHGTLVSDVLYTGPQRWADADAEPAWQEALSFFQDYKNAHPPVTGGGHTTYNGAELSQIIMDHLHATSDRLCQFVPNDACNTIVPCDDQFPEGATGVSTPAGYMITNSFANIHMLIDEMYNAINDAVQEGNGLTTEVVDDFVMGGQAANLALQLDIVGLLFSLVAAPFWNSWLKNSMGTSYRNWENTAGTLKDALDGIVSNGLDYIKDSLESLDGVSKALAFQALITSMGEGMIKTLNSNAALLFDGKNTSTLNGLLTGGSAAANSLHISPAEMTNNFYKAMVVITMPVAWAANALPTAVVVWFTGKGMGNGNSDITTCNGAEAAASGLLDSLVLGNDVPARFVCDTATDTPYWLGYIGRNCDWLPPSKVGNTWDCGPDASLVQGPTGIGNVDGTKFGGLTMEDLLISSLKAFRNNGNKNGWSAVDPKNQAVVADVADSGVQAAGVFSAPFCSYVEAMTNFKNTVAYNEPRSANWPCN
ncbi:hypothetical protein CONLIGDRAFT_711208 [Coniochaeta ligniaria NRRL 30616]|uniref:Glycoside hydrolase n=1 Tax=Coniochaeta ligniaria NRRL 30616 TaxID=1408157 RepID=A0A1J7JIU1_9PEZI|nr:hypothetical protein CONLIGDRAFT_711208 [Coniochaeta ligniaria NRRL 30616]